MVWPTFPGLGGLSFNSLGPGSALRKKGEKNRRGRKKKIGERSEAQGSLGRGKGGPHFLPFSPTVEPVPGYLRRDLNMG